MVNGAEKASKRRTKNGLSDSMIGVPITFTEGTSGRSTSLPARSSKEDEKQEYNGQVYSIHADNSFKHQIAIIALVTLSTFIG